MKKRRKKRSLGRAIAWLLSTIISVAVIAAAAFAVYVLLWSPGKAQPYKDAYGNILDNSISEVAYAEIGGIQQGMILKGRNLDNPVLLFLHGGPGSPEYMFAAPSHLRMEELFTVCWWEQRGSGISYSAEIPADTMTLTQFVQDTVEVAEYLKARFGQEKIYLMGHSWGSVLGAHVAAQYPELFHAYIGVGQVSDQMTSEQLAYAYMRDAATTHGDADFVEALEEFSIETPADLTPAYMRLRSQGLNSYGGGMKRVYGSDWAELVMPTLLCKEYTVRQKMNYLRGMDFTQTHMWEVVLADNLAETVPALDIPVYIVHGLHDYQVSHTLAQAYYESLEAPEKHFYTFEASAHSPLFEEPSAFMRILREDVLGQ